MVATTVWYLANFSIACCTQLLGVLATSAVAARILQVFESMFQLSTGISQLSVLHMFLTYLYGRLPQSASRVLNT